MRPTQRSLQGPVGVVVQPWAHVRQPVVAGTPPSCPEVLRPSLVQVPPSAGPHAIPILSVTPSTARAGPGDHPREQEGGGVM